MAKAVLKSIQDLVDEKFYICAYQRGYRWNDTQMKELLFDLFEFTRQPAEKIPEYCLQPIIVQKREDGSWELVDGQQRFTALWIIMQLRACVTRKPTNTYTLTYEEKDRFTRLIEDVANETKSNFDPNDICEKFSGRKEDSLDSCMFIESLEAVVNFVVGSDDMFTIIPAITNNLNRVKVIWYELENEDAIEMFTNVNANKIRLTNAELIKAVLLRNIDDKNIERDFANEWENIEKELNKDDLWYFITGNKYYATRIDLLFEIWSELHSSIDDDYFNDQQYAVFRKLNAKMKDYGALNIWNDIKKICESIQDWYDSYDLYHLVGMLSIIENSSVHTIKRLYTEYDIKSKSEFRRYILNEIRNKYIGLTKLCISQNSDKESIKAALKTISYDDSQKVKNILLLYNISILVNAKNLYERFPFRLYKNERWDIEHVNPQTPGEENDVDRRKWLESYRKIVDEELRDEIDKCLNDSLDGFAQVASDITSKLHVADIDYIGNLVLLDKNTNSSYKNACFSEKRMTIIEIERTAQQEKTSTKFIPIGTKWVFLKGYENADNFIVWGANDVDDYVEDMANTICKMLEGDK